MDAVTAPRGKPLIPATSSRRASLNKGDSMRRFGLTAVLCLALSLAVLAPCLADQERGSLSGALSAQPGAGLAQVVLTLRGPDRTRSVVTGPDGRFHFADLPPGRYTLSADLPGFALTGAEATIAAGQETHLSPALVPASLREHVVVSATRSDAALSTLGTSVTVLDRDRIEAIQPATTLDLLRGTPGVAVARSGGIGSQASAFVRGGESRFASVLVDGVPINEPGGDINLGTLLPLELARVEIVRGAASSLYASDALAGVIQLVSRSADAGASPDAHASLEAGSFHTRRLVGGTSGRARGWDWNVGGLRQETDNQQPNSRLAETAGAASFGRSLGERAALRFVLRGDTSTGGTPGATDFYRADLDARYERSDLLALAQVRVASDRTVHEWRLGVGSTNQLSVNPADSGPYTPTWAGHTGYPGSDLPNPEGFQNNTRRATASYLVEAQLAPRQLLTAGFDLERESGAIGERRAALLSPERTNVGAYVQDRIVIGERAFLTLGGRLERNDSYGWAAVPRAALALRVRSGPDSTTLRASAGAGIKEPSFIESFGVSLFTRGNPRLDPERSRTFDLGLDQRLAGGHVRAEATLFDHTYLKEIAYFIESYDPFLGTYTNIGKTRARGVEFALEAAPTSALRLSAEYTYLDGKILVSTTDFDPVYAVGRSLLRRPKHQASLAADGEAGRFSASATVFLVGRRADSDFLGMGLEENSGYARLDARVRARVGRGLEVFLAAENLLDRKYMEVLGYPALGRSVRMGLRLRSVRAERS